MSDAVQELWSQTVSYIYQRNTTEQSQICSFLGYLTPEKLSESELIVSTNNKFAKGWIEKNYFMDVKDALFNVTGIDFNFRIVISDVSDSFSLLPANESESTRNFLDQRVDDKTLSTSSPEISTPSQQNPYDIHTQTSHRSGYHAFPSDTNTFAGNPGVSSSLNTTPTTNSPLSIDLNEISGSTDGVFIGAQRKPLTDERTFESFIVGDSNRYAFSAALGVAKSPGNIYNPLFIYGDSGLGKTHLLLAVENYIRSNQPHLKTTYAQTSDFVRDFTSMLYNDEKRRKFEQQYHQSEYRRQNGPFYA